MTRPQYVMLCLIGGLAIVAYLEAYRVGQTLKNMTGGRSPQPGGVIA